MRIVFFGTPALAVPSLEALVAEHDVAAVVCQPDRPAGRNKRPTSPPTKIWADEHGIEVQQPKKLNDGTFEAWLRDVGPEVCVLVAYGRILKQSILDVSPKGFLNVHPSLLPKHRGPSPIQTAVLQGDAESGVTIMKLDAGRDPGDALLQRAIPIGPDDTTESLSERLAQLGAELILEAVKQVETGSAVFIKQDHSLATYTRMFEKDDGVIHWHMRASDIRNLVRAAIPWPVAHCRLDGETIRVHQAQVLDLPLTAPPGAVIRATKNELVVATGEKALAIEVLQAPGKKAMPVGDFLRGNPIEEGARFEDA